jgi:predicted RNase H-like HicB family nuclease
LEGNWRVFLQLPVEEDELTLIRRHERTGLPLGDNKFVKNLRRSRDAVRCWRTMERIINIHIEKLPEGVYLATSEDMPGLVAQGRTVTESLEIARDVARKLVEARAERRSELKLSEIGDSFDYPLIVSA